MHIDDDFYNDIDTDAIQTIEVPLDMPEGAHSRARGSHGKKRGKKQSDSRRTKKSGKLNPIVKRIIIFSILEVFVLAGIFSYAYVMKQYNKIQRPEVNVEEVRNQNLSLQSIEEIEKGYWNIAVFGVDTRDSSLGEGANSDVNIIVSINRETGEIKLVSVFRDTYLKIGNNSYNKMNAAYCNGGPEKALKTINENLDLNITEYATFNWKAVATGINILGGVDIELSKAEFYYINSYITETVKATGIGSHQLEHAGLNHLDGVQAVAYARLRYMDNDYARTERQRKVISLLFDKAKKADLQTLNDLLGNMLEMVATNLTWQDGIDAIAAIDKYHMGDTAGFPAARGEANVGKYGDCVIPQTLESNVRDLHAFLFPDVAYEPSDAVKDISKNISAASGMYNEGTAVGHVSTQGYIPASTKSASEASDSEAETDENGETVSEASPGNVKKTKTEYAISKDGYLIYVIDIDDRGNKKYAYVRDDDGNRVPMIEYGDDGEPIYLFDFDDEGNAIIELPKNMKEPEDAYHETVKSDEREGSDSNAIYGPGNPNPNEPESTASKRPGPGDNTEAETDESTSESEEGNYPGGPGTPGSNPGPSSPEETSPALEPGSQEGPGSNGPGSAPSTEGPVAPHP